jgi:ubiquinone/menaquinone biosynthesis C-methylase UbiE
MSRDPALQRCYYAETAGNYDEMHISPDDEHYVSLSYISAFVRQLGVRTVLDVGCGTGRAAVYFRENNSEINVYGIEPVPELLDVGVNKGLSRNYLVRGSGLGLPFRSNSFDAVIECGVLHHLQDPGRAVSEMMRVARRAIFLSDSNIFGQGRPTIRLLKLMLYKAGLWSLVKLLQTRGTGYTVSQGDGVAYSYSVYFQHKCLNKWAERVLAIPVRRTGSNTAAWSVVLGADTVLLCGIRD